MSMDLPQLAISYLLALRFELGDVCELGRLAHAARNLAGGVIRAGPAVQVVRWQQVVRF